MNCRNTTKSPGQRTRWWGKALALATLLVGVQVNAQVSSYTFGQSSGTYTEITGGTVIATATSNSGATSLDDVVYPVNFAPYSFTFNGTAYSACNVSTNGFLTFGATAPATALYTPISGTTAYAGAIAGWGGDINAMFNVGGFTGELRWEVVGTAPNRELVLQWRNFRPGFSTSATAAYRINFQIRLLENGNLVRVVYGPAGIALGSPTNPFSNTRQNGLRGATNADFNNRTNTTLVSFNASTAGGTNAATQAFNIVGATPGMPSNGLTYTWTPPVPCTGTPTAGTIPATGGFCAPSGTVNLTATGFTSGVTGITFQWEESDDNGVGDAWANAVGGTGATTSSYTSPTLSTNIFYRLRVTCTPSGLSATTNASAVSVVFCSYDVSGPSASSFTSIMPANGGSGTAYPGWVNVDGDDNTSTAVSLAGTTFQYRGNVVSGFRACTNGWMTFNTGSTSTAFTNDLSGTGQNQVLAPFWDDLVLTGQAFANRDASMRYQVSGTLGSGSAVITIEWAGVERFNIAGPNLNFQVKLFEAGNIVEFIYGNFEGFDGTVTSPYSYSIGYNGTSPATVSANERFNMTTAVTNHWTTTASNSNVVMPSCFTKFVLTPGVYTGPVSAPSIPAPANDNSGTATALTVNAAPCTQYCPIYYTSRSATNSGLGTAGCTTTAGNEDDDVWFSFTANGVNNYLLTLRSSPSYDGVLQLFQGDATTNIACVNATAGGLIETYTTSGLAAGTYFVRVFHNGLGIGTSSGQFALCVSEVVPPPANDNICGAIGLTVNPTCVTTAGNTLSATASPQTACAGTPDDDIWYSFTAATTGDVITVQGTGSFNAHLQVFSSSDQTCTGTLTSLICNNLTSTGGAETYSGPWTAGNTYFIRVYHSAGGAASGAFTICVTATAPACATGLSPANAAVVCGNATPQNITWTATSGASGYDVFFDAGAGPATTLVSSNQPGTSYNAGTLALGQYTYRIVPRNNIGPAAGCTDITFNVNAVPTATITPSGPTTFCTPGSVDLTASAGGSYLWAPGGATTQTITVSTSGSYTVQVTTAGCSATSAATVVTANQSPTIVSTTATPTAICAGGTSQLQVNTPPPSAYCNTVAFTSGVEAISNVTFADINNSSACAIGLAAGGAIQDFTAVVGNVVAGSSYTITVTGTTDGNFTNFFTAFFDWNQDGVFEAQQAIGSITNTACILTASTSITVPVGALNGTTRMRVIKVYNSSPTNPCGTFGYGQAEDYTLSVTGGSQPFTYLWDNAGSLSSATIANPIATPTVTTTYQVTVTAGNGCPATGNVQVNVQAAPNAGTNGSLTICAGSTVTEGQLFAQLGGTPDGGGAWTPALAGAGVYTYTVTATAPCVVNATATVTVTEQTAPDAGTNGTLTICINGAATDLFSLLGGSPDATGTWSGPSALSGGNLGTFTPPAAAGVYTYTVTGVAPCADASATVTVSYDNTDTDGDAIIDCLDNCPTTPGQIGSACNDGNPNTVLDVLDGTCTCVGQACTTDLVFQVNTDGNGTQTTWEIRTTGTNILVQSGGGTYPNNVTFTDNTCLPDGCYYLRVFDAGGDGIANGGYVLRTLVGAQRIIDNRGNFTTGSVSAVINNGGFCLPLGTDRLIFTSCDKLDWVSNQFIVAAENPAVSAQFGVTNTTSGYQFWWFDPNGTYGYAKFRSHATSDGFGTGATRACHARINNWSPNQIPANVLMNVKVRGRVNGNNLPWGPVCRFMIDPVRAACPFTKLVDIPGNTNFSCGVTRTWGGSSLSKVVAKAVDGATQYQFRWNNAELAAPVIRTTTTPVLQLNWNPALDNGTYQVQVRAFKNGVWCVTSLPWGDECNVTITGSPNAMSVNGGSTTSTGDAKLAMFPNPNNGEQLTVSLSAVEEGVNTISVDIFDLSGARVSSRTMAVNDGMVYQVLSLGEMADGLYMVNITAGNQRYTERLVIAK